MNAATNGEAAIVDIRKLRDDCLSRDHPRGRHKAQVFEATLGMTAEDAEELRVALQRAASWNEASLGVSDSYGTRYIIDFDLDRNGGKIARIRSGWIVLVGERQPRFVTCFVL